jgi:hypothetical protein
LEPWRAAVVAHPEVIDYCREREIRHETWKQNVYLLRKRKMNGAHAELFSFILHLELSARPDKFHPLQLGSYQSVAGTSEEPYFNMMFNGPKNTLDFRIESDGGNFEISLAQTQAVQRDGLEKSLRDSLEFKVEGGRLVCSTPQEQIRDRILGLAAAVQE